AGPDEDRCRAGLVDRNLIACRLGALGPPQLQDMAPGVDNSDHHAVAVSYRLFLGGCHHGVGAIGIQRPSHADPGHGGAPPPASSSGPSTAPAAGLKTPAPTPASAVVKTTSPPGPPKG